MNLRRTYASVAKNPREDRIRKGYAFSKAMNANKGSFKKKTSEKRIKGLVRTHSRKYLNKVR